MLTITDQHSDKGSLTVEPNEVAAALRSWWPDAPREFVEGMDRFQAAIVDGADIRHFEAWFGVGVTRT